MRATVGRGAIALLVAIALAVPVPAAATVANTIQWQPLPAMVGVASLRYERGLGSVAAVAVHGAYGKGNHMATFAGRTYAEAGGQLRLYLAGTFADGLAFGLGGAWVGLPGNGYGERGWVLGPKLAAKFAVWRGLTAELEIGASVVRRTADVVGGGQVVATDLQPSANLGLGWSF